LDKYVRLHLLSPNRLWTSHVVNATIVPGLHADIILGLDFLRLNKIVIDVDENTAVCKDDGYDLLNPPSNPLTFKGSLPVFPPLRRKLERDAIWRAHADLRPSRIAIHNELNKLFTDNPARFLGRLAAFTTVRPNFIGAIKTRILELAELDCLNKLDEKFKKLFHNVFPSDIPHVTNLPDDVVHHIEVLPGSKFATSQPYSCPRKYYTS